MAQATVRPWRYPSSLDLQYGEWPRGRFEAGGSLPLQAAVNTDLTILLRLARIWQTVVTGSIDRKDLAAGWAQARLPPEYRPLMERAQAGYLGRQPDAWMELASAPGG